MPPPMPESIEQVVEADALDPPESNRFYPACRRRGPACSRITECNGGPCRTIEGDP